MRSNGFMVCICFVLCQVSFVDYRWHKQPNMMLFHKSAVRVCNKDDLRTSVRTAQFEVLHAICWAKLMATTKIAETFVAIAVYSTCVQLLQ